MINDYAALKVGDMVAVARHGSWNITNQGIYVVSKVNKVKVTVQRIGDNYERVFSVRKRRELNGFDDEYYSAFLETVEEQTARENQRRREVEVKNMWREAEGAATRRNLTQLKDLVEKLSQVTV